MILIINAMQSFLRKSWQLESSAVQLGVIVPAKYDTLPTPA